MTKGPGDNGRKDKQDTLHTNSTSRALSTALRKTFESLADEPVPDRLRHLIARIREAEIRRGGKD